MRYLFLLVLMELSALIVNAQNDVDTTILVGSIPVDFRFPAVPPRALSWCSPAGISAEQISALNPVFAQKP